MHYMGNEPLHVREGTSRPENLVRKYLSYIFFMVFIAINKTLCMEQNDHWLMSISCDISNCLSEINIGDDDISITNDWLMLILLIQQLAG